MKICLRQGIFIVCINVNLKIVLCFTPSNRLCKIVKRKNNLFCLHVLCATCIQSYVLQSLLVIVGNGFTLYYLGKRCRRYKEYILCIVLTTVMVRKMFKYLPSETSKYNANTTHKSYNTVSVIKSLKGKLNFLIN